MRKHSQYAHRYSNINKNFRDYLGKIEQSTNNNSKFPHAGCFNYNNYSLYVKNCTCRCILSIVAY